MYKIRKWLFAKLWILTMHVAPVNVRAVAQRAVDIGMRQMEKEQDDLRNG